MKRFQSVYFLHGTFVFALLLLIPDSHASGSVKVGEEHAVEQQTPIIEDATEISGVVLENDREEDTEPEQRTVALFLNITRNALNTTKQHLLDTNINILGHEITFNPDDVAEDKKIKSLLTDIIQDEFGPQDNDFANRQSRNLHVPTDSNLTIRQGRGSKGSKSSKSKAKKVTTTTTTAPPLKRLTTKKPKQTEEERQTRYNGYIDAVLDRMNDLIRSKRMDPLRVNLFAGNGATRATTTTTTPKPKPSPKPLAKVTKGKPSKSNDKNKSSNKVDSKPAAKPPAKKPTPLKKPPQKGSKGDKKKPAKTTKATKAAKTNVHKQKKKPKPQMRYHTINNRQRIRSRALMAEADDLETGQYEERSYINGAPVLLKLADRWNPATAEASSSSSERRSHGSDAVETIRGVGGGNNRPVRGILHGLSTLRRSGPVKVIRRASSSRIVKAKFLLGPVSLDILPKKSSAKSSNDPTATATAKALKGVIEISLQKDGTTSIRKLRVHPPSSVRFDGDGKRVKQQESYRKLGSMTSQKLLIVANQVLGRSRL